MNRMLWIDIETTALDPQNGRIIEVALAVTDVEVAIQDQMRRLVYPGQSPIGDRYALDMHHGSGLLAEAMEGPAPTLAQADLCAFVLEIGMGCGALAGSNPNFDRRWVTAHMPGLASLLPPRSFDLASVRRLLGLRHANRRHTAIDDLLEDIALLRALQCPPLAALRDVALDLPFVADASG